ncbi:MAG: hypothetical protein U0166_12420 [Acidobacteriota bacterium]
MHRLEHGGLPGWMFPDLAEAEAASDLGPGSVTMSPNMLQVTMTSSCEVLHHLHRQRVYVQVALIDLQSRPPP